MTKILKVEAWDGEKMVSPDYIDREGVAWWKENSIPKYSKKVRQSTGLFDKNGTEVYEGDILAYVNPLSPKNGKVKGHIVWDNCSYRLKRFRGTETQLDKLTAPSYMNSHIVVGNIYETPELLK